MAEETKPPLLSGLVVLDENTPVARWPRRIVRMPREAGDRLPAWNEAARLRPVEIVLSPLNRPSGRRALGIRRAGGIRIQIFAAPPPRPEKERNHENNLPAFP
jgi:hypothetical protein